MYGSVGFQEKNLVRVGLLSAFLVVAAAQAANAPPANKLAGYAGYELAAVQMEADIAANKNADKVLARVNESMRKEVEPILIDWNAKAASAANTNKLLLEPRIISLHKPSGANRFFAGAFSGQSRIVVKVRIVEQPSGKLIGEPEFYQHANAIAGAWTVGATDNKMLDRIATLVAGYLRGNYEQAVGSETGYEK
jgi:hypothetical protein